MSSPPGTPRVERLADGLTALLGCWALLSWGAVYGGASFDVLRMGVPAAVVAAAVLFGASLRDPAAGPVAAAPPAGPSTGALELGTLAVGFLAWLGWWQGLVPLPLAGGLSVVHLATLLRTARAPLPPLEWRAVDSVAVAVAAVATVLVTLALSRPDIDDAYYFSAILGTLAHPDRAVLSFDTMHGVPGAPIQQLIHRPQTLELLAAVVASVPGLSAEDAYYVVLPAGFGALTALATGLVLGRLAPGSVGPALVAWFLLLLVWGDGHRTWGNYAFVRLFQGKSVFLLALAPLVVHQAFAFVERATPARWGLLVCAVAAAASATSSALVLAPVVAGLALLGATTPDRSGGLRLVAGLTSVGPVLAVLALVQWEIAHEAPLVTEGDVLALDAVTGTGVRGPLAIALALALPWLLHRAGSPAAAGATRFVGATFLFVLNGVSAPLLAGAVALLSWRLYWAALVPVLAAASLGVVASRVWAAFRSSGPDPAPSRREALVLGALAAVAIGVFVLSGRWTPDPTNHVDLAFAQPKRPDFLWGLATEVVERTPPGTEVLAPTRLACWLTSFDDGPALVAVRPFYTSNLARFWGAEESRDRQLLQDLVEGDTNPARTRQALEAFDARCISVVVTGPEARKRGTSHAALKERGFQREKRRAWDLWTRPAQPCP
ncbi:MAG: DUF6077 domain-containing protein [Myxococcota bacterium]